MIFKCPPLQYTERAREIAVRELREQQVDQCLKIKIESSRQTLHERTDRRTYIYISRAPVEGKFKTENL